MVDLLISYITDMRNAGYKDEKIRLALLTHYPQERVDKLYNQIRFETDEGIPPDELLTDESLDSVKKTGIKKRSPVLVIIFSVLTLGIYYLIWYAKTSIELHNNTKNALNPWILFIFLVPVINIIVGLYYHWQYCKSVKELTGANNILLFVLGVSGLASPLFLFLTQLELNKLSD